MNDEASSTSGTVLPSSGVFGRLLSFPRRGASLVLSASRYGVAAVCSASCLSATRLLSLSRLTISRLASSSSGAAPRPRLTSFPVKRVFSTRTLALLYLAGTRGEGEEEAGCSSHSISARLAPLYRRRRDDNEALSSSLPDEEEEDMEGGGGGQWHGVPVDVMGEVLSYLEYRDRYNASLVCTSWVNAFRLNCLWRRFKFCYMKEEDERYIRLFDHCGSSLRTVHVELNQGVEKNRDLVCRTLRSLASKAGSSLSSLTITFKGSHPPRYTGDDIVEALTLLVSTTGRETKNRGTRCQGLQQLHLCKLRVPLTNSFLDALAVNSHITVLDMQNELPRALKCGLSPAKLSEVVQQCRHLKELQCHYSAMSDQVLAALALDNRAPLKFLSVLCRGPKINEDALSEDAWKLLRYNVPHYRVRLIFDHTVLPVSLISIILKPSIPLRDVVLRTFTGVFDQLDQITLFYSETLEKVVVHTTPSRALFGSLMGLAENCQMLRSLHVYCSLPHDLINKIYDTRPELKETYDVTLCKEEMGVLVFVGKPQEDRS